MLKTAVVRPTGQLPGASVTAKITLRLMPAVVRLGRPLGERQEQRLAERLVRQRVEPQAAAQEQIARPPLLHHVRIIARFIPAPTDVWPTVQIVMPHQRLQVAQAHQSL